jgi:hypothetical protein
MVDLIEVRLTFRSSGPWLVTVQLKRGMVLRLVLKRV